MKKALIIFFGVLLAFVAIFVFKLSDFYNTINTGQNSKPTLPPGKTTFNILLLGYGGEGHDGAYLTDTMMVAHVDTEKNTVSLISLPRDLWVNVPGKPKDFHAKINSVYEMGLFSDDYPAIKDEYSGEQGAAEMAKKVVGEVTGLEIDRYVGMDFDGFIEIINKVDGIDVNVETTFDDYEYPLEGKQNEMCGREEEFKQIEPFLDPEASEEAKLEFFKDKEDLKKFYENITDEPPLAFPCRYEHLHFNKGKQHMDGITALKFARSRHSLQDGTDFGRAKRQQKVLEAVKNKVFSISFLPKILPLMEEAKKFVRMDFEFDLTKKLLGEAQKDSSKYTIISIVPSLENYLSNGVSDYGQFILIPSAGIDEWGEMQTWIRNSIEGITPTPTLQPETATGSGTRRASPTPTE